MIEDHSETARGLGDRGFQRSLLIPVPSGTKLRPKASSAAMSPILRMVTVTA